MTFDKIFELKYFGMIYQECLRMMPPAQGSSFNTCLRDITVGDISLKKGDVFNIAIYGLHVNPQEWKDPDRFIPERFDSESPLSLTPTG